MVDKILHRHKNFLTINNENEVMESVIFGI